MSTAAKARKLADAHEKAKGRVEELAAKAAAAEDFDDPGDVSKVLSARRAVEEAKAERDMLAVAFATAEQIHAAAVEEEKKRETEERNARARKEAESFAASITADLVAVGKKLAAHEALADSLPASERFRFWPATYAENASKVLSAGAKTVRQIDLRLLIANP